MAISITIRDVPVKARDELAGRAARTGRSLQEYLRAQLIELANRPDVETILANIHERKQRTASRLPADKILSSQLGSSVMLVVDAALMVAALIDGGPDGSWAESLLSTDQLAAPHLLPVEVASTLRRAIKSGDISADSASMAHADLLSLRVELFPYSPFASRVWELRDNVTAYDAWYVALAESLNANLATLDVRLSRAPGLRCAFQTPPQR